MAGIGFELQRVLRRGGVGSFLQVAFAGIIIVAGPWLLSIVGIFLITHLAASVLREGEQLFLAVVVYSYAFSLMIFGGLHYLFTRIVADQIYEHKDGEAGASLALFSAAAFIASALVALPFVLSLDAAGITRPVLFRVASVGLFAAINLLWIMMIFVSLLKKFAGIFFAYFSGMAMSVAGTILLGAGYGLGGAMAGFAAGQLAAGLLLWLLLLRAYRPTGFRQLPAIIRNHLGRYRFLVLTGLIYYWGIWVDKIVFWFGAGYRAGGTFLHLYDAYDIPVYLASLTMIPGLVYFVVVLETDFYLQLMQFLKAMERSVLRTILAEKYRLVRQISHGVREQALFQAAISAALIAGAGFLLPRLGFGAVSTAVFDVLVAAVFFNLMFLTLLTLLFYLEVYERAFAASLLFFLVNLGISLLTVLTGHLALRGVGYLAAGIIGCVVAYLFLLQSANKLERLIYMRYSTD
ncbi:MAG TPA: exopolysaccharide Pel transporter PelG [Spirochaetia bacterium]|nr:exopolysaccharide Pel transporter PelG [Spirochaetia bacterium]